MTLKNFEQPAAWMVHDLGPRRYHERFTCMERWAGTELGRRVLAVMARHGLDRRDAYVGDSKDRTEIKTDAGYLRIEDRTLAAHLPELDAIFASVAAGVAQERMMRLSGWRPCEELPFWAVTASEVLVERLRKKRVRPVQLWNAGVNIDEDGWIDRRSFCTRADDYSEGDPRAALPLDCYVARYGTGLHLWWREGDLDYHERTEGATLTLPTALLATGDAAALVGKRMGEVCAIDTRLGRALAGYEIVAATAIEPHPHAITPEPHCTELRLSVPMRTLQPIPETVLARAGVDVPANVERDRPLWMLTAPALLLRYRPRLPKAA